MAPSDSNIKPELGAFAQHMPADWYEDALAATIANATGEEILAVPGVRELLVAHYDDVIRRAYERHQRRRVEVLRDELRGHGLELVTGDQELNVEWPIVVVKPPMNVQAFAASAEGVEEWAETSGINLFPF